MIAFPHCKINLGLDIVARRSDGFHEIDTVMVPVHGLCDSLEIVPADGGEVSMFFSGLAVDCAPEQNIVMKAWQLMHEAFGIPPVRIHLHKVIPFGAGLGGGSSDGAFALRMLAQLFQVECTDRQLEELAVKLGSDVPFFLYDRPLRCTGRGEIMEPIELSLLGYWIVLVKPPIHISTAEAYAQVVPEVPAVALPQRLGEPMERWHVCVGNDFEKMLWGRYPRLAALKESLYGAGACYASLSGSGSTLYGLFTEKPTYVADADCAAWCFEL